MQRVLIRFKNRIIVIQLMQSEIFRQIILIEYFFMNKRVRNVERNDVFFYEYKNIVKDFKQYLYQNIFNHFIWKTTKNWAIRKLNRTLNRMFFIKSKIKKMFYFRLLFTNRKKCIFFNDLKIVFVQIENVELNIIQLQWMKFYKNVCAVFDLIDNDNE